MSIFDSFDGIAIHLYANDHVPPHCHVIYAEHEALIDIRSQTVLKGSLPKKKLKLATAYIADPENQADLLETFYQLNPRIMRIEK